MFSQARAFGVYGVEAYRLCGEISPDFIIGTTSRLMTGVLTGISAHKYHCPYFIDLRDIFSETISDLLSRKNRLLGILAKNFFSLLDRRLLNGAAGVSVVSEGFPSYFHEKEVDTSS
jgi:hypothetical protein